MEHLIMQDFTEKRNKVKIDPKLKFIIIALMIIVIIYAISMFFQKYILGVISLIFLIAGIITLLVLEKKDEKRRREEIKSNMYGESKNGSINNSELLKTVLEKYNIRNLYQIDELIKKYKKYIDKYEQKNKAQTTFFGAAFTAILSFVTLFIDIVKDNVSYEIILVLVSSVFLIYFIIYFMEKTSLMFDDTYSKYSSMISWLEDYKIYFYEELTQSKKTMEVETNE